MHRTDDLARKANALADLIRRVRSEPQAQAHKGRDLSAMQSQLTDLWTQIRAARVEDAPPAQIAGAPAQRKTYSKWR